MMAINRYRLKTLISKNNVQAKRVEKLLNNLDYLIGAILLGNNFVNILAASIATLLSIKLYGEGSVIIASIVLTIVILIFAENTPKTFAAKNPEKIALPASWLLELIINHLATTDDDTIVLSPQFDLKYKRNVFQTACTSKRLEAVLPQFCDFVRFYAHLSRNRRCRDLRTLSGKFFW